MAQITEDYVSFETAKLLREKGFEEVCSAYYEDFGKKQCLYIRDKRGAYNIGFKQREDLENRFNLPKERYKCDAPTLQMAMKWLREIHKLFCSIGYDDLNYNWTIIDISSDTDKQPYYASKSYAGYVEYEQACEAAIKCCLENLI